MFVDILTPEQQAALYAFAKRLTLVDGELHENESKILGVIEKQMAPEALTLTPEAPETLFTTRASQIALLLELVGIALADHDYEHKEKTMILDIAEAIGATAQDVDKVESWVSEQMQLLSKAYALMED